MWFKNLDKESMEKFDNAKEVVYNHWHAHCSSIGAREPHWQLATGRAFIEIQAIIGDKFQKWCEDIDVWHFDAIEQMMVIGSNPHYTLENIDALFTFETLHRTYYHLGDASRHYVIQLASNGTRITKDLLTVIEGKFMEGDRPQKAMQIEADLEDALCQYLRNRGATYQRQVRCAVGRADVVTPTAVYEVKHTLNSQNIFRAVGQVLIYRDCINFQAKPILVATQIEDSDIAKAQVRVIQGMGIELLIWNDIF